MMPVRPASRWMLAGLLIIASILIFYAASWNGGAQHHAQQSNMLLELKELDARLDRDVLRITSFLLVQYDPLVETTNRLRRLKERLGSPSKGFYGSMDKLVDSALDAYWESMQEKLQLLERIKSEAAVVRNGIHYLPLAAKGLEATNSKHYQEVLQLLNQLYIYYLISSTTRLQQIEQQIDRLQQQAETQGEPQKVLRNILFHMSAILKGLSRLNRLKQRFIAIQTQQRFDYLHDVYELHRTGDRRHTQQISMLLALALTVLLTSLWWLLSKLERARLTAETALKRLHDGVESLSEAFALFDAKGRLVLHNQRYRMFYPWLGKQLTQGLALTTIQEQNGSQLQQADMDGQAIHEQLPLHLFMERLDQGKWYLASNNPTSEGGLVCVRTDITETKRAELELRKLSRALEQSPASVLITDTEGTIEYVNPKFEQISGYSSEEAIGKNPRILKSGDKSREDYKELWETIKAGREWRGAFHNKRKDGTIYWESASISPLRNEGGEITHFIAVKEDITAQKRAEEQLRMNATVFETTTEGIMVTDADNRIKTVNPAFTRITGYQAEEVIGRNPRLLSSGRHDQAFYRAMWASVKQQGSWSGEVWNRRKDGSIYPEWLSVAAIRTEQGAVSEYIAVFSDITQRKESEQQIRFQANYDALTGLPNRSLLLDRLTHAINSAEREAWELALLFVDLDQFKIVNDTFGHVMGDELLQHAAERLKSCVRESDTVARFGGDEFIILLQDISGADDAAQIADKVIEKLSRYFLLASREVIIGASIGITLFPDDASDSDTLLRNADMAMYRAKETGRNRYQFFTTAMQEQVSIRQHLEQDLRGAPERNELELHYQPVVSATDGRLVSMEALLRWHHPDQGLIPPDQFIPLAEETGLIGPIGVWVMSTACRQAALWQAQQPGLKIAVNISSRQRELGLSANLLELILQETGLDSSLLTLEMTESLLMEDTEEAVTWLESFKALGVALAIDDFGTGYSSLSYLKRFPVDVLKIDRAFVSDLPDDQEDASLVEAIVAIAQSLELKLIAEGVETAEQAKFLDDIGCDYLQGYHFSKPKPASEFTEQLAGEST
ncbi:PAS domain S-box/diguanylate cyclase (GGDEF) domain [endosymbiont of Ridgeia piscesae]|jgi:diguanylate cyclase (GGDEF)-like protein/PAS domain S-box-containing protein|uniref:cyclic-guanylate-specific phosphodiesterase n=3 Tax=endosymbiont of Ridgeia piscesae TaxID=54398 RepID=A0A0T5YVU8_9GAMM|nr:EAL domain-containing protein [endosymbiont of Ridgeia piscesae]KRT54350.1 PAS domain S-box/diguanylate cyclase (GGDEF) domain [endosymbiont of Ridgeia piscesae]